MCPAKDPVVLMFGYVLDIEVSIKKRKFLTLGHFARAAILKKMAEIMALQCFLLIS